MMCVSVLTSCGKSQVHYQENGKTTKESGQQEEKNTNTTGTKEQWEAQGNGLDSGLARTLGLTQSTWEEDVSSKGADQYLDAKIRIPEAGSLSTMTVREWYMDNEDKKALCDAIFDEGTVEVDTSYVQSKEKIRAELNRLDKYIKEEHQEEFYEDEKEYQILYARLSKKYAKAKKMSEISRDPGEYEADAYLGKVNGVYMTLLIRQNARQKSNLWRLETLDYTGYLQNNPKQSGKFIKEHQICINGKTLKQMGYCYGDNERETDEKDNLCSFGSAQAAVRAGEYCEKLGLTGMQAVAVETGVISVEDSTREDGSYQEVNGYVVRLRRQVGEAAAADFQYVAGSGNGSGNHKEFPAEEISLYLNDAGVLWMDCYGMMKEEKTESISSVLSFGQVQEVFRRKLSKLNQDRIEGREWRALYLEMVRLKNHKKPGEYRYIPVWALCREEDDTQPGWAADREISSLLCINAIDGTEIDVKKDCGYEELDMTLINKEFDVEVDARDNLRSQNRQQ